MHARTYANARLRYSEFDDLRQKLLAAFPHAKNALPPLPPKSVLCMLQQIFIWRTLADIP